MRNTEKSIGNILVVERNPGQRSFAAAALATAGYWVAEAGDPWQAFSICESLQRPLHLLATEVGPGRDLGGVELYRHLSALRPGLKVLYLSSVPAEAALREELEAALDSFLSKPYPRDALLAKVARLLTRGEEDGRALWTRRRADWRPAGESAAGA